MSNYAKIIVGIRTKGKDIMLKITVIDDEKEYSELIRQTIDNWLMEKGCQGEIDCFDHAEDFKAQIEAGRCYDIYFMDIEMPDISGISLAKELQKLKNAPAVVLMSSIPGFSLEAWKIQAYGFIEKPYTKQDIMKMVERYRRESENGVDGSF